MSLLYKLPDDSYDVGHAHGCLCKTATDTPVSSPVLTGRFYISASGWGLLSVPNGLVRGMFEAMQEPGIELPPGAGDPPGPFNAHISVMRKDDVLACGGGDKIKERGEVFRYQLGPIKSVTPMGWDDMSKVWFVEVQSPELKTLRKSYGLPPLPTKDDNELQFHITIAVRRKHVLKDNEVKKAAGVAGQAWNSTPLIYHPGLGPFANMAQHLSAVGTRTNRLLGEQNQLQQFRSQTDPNYAMERTRQALANGPQRPEVLDQALSALPGLLPMAKLSATIDRLKTIKEHSDQKRYGHKAHLLRHELKSDPENFTVASDGAMSSVVHTPSDARDPKLISRRMRWLGSLGARRTKDGQTASTVGHTAEMD